MYEIKPFNRNRFGILFLEEDGGLTFYPSLFLKDLPEAG